MKGPAIRGLILATAAVMITGPANLIPAAASPSARAATWTIYEPTKVSLIHPSA